MEEESLVEEFFFEAATWGACDCGCNDELHWRVSPQSCVLGRLAGSAWALPERESKVAVDGEAALGGPGLSCLVCGAD